MQDSKEREQVIVRTSLIGIAVNVLLAAFKAAVGLLSNSIAIVLDAVNNLSDALSSVITILGAKLAGKKPDKKHPLGYGRIEYLSAMIVSGLVLYAGITSLVESVKKILNPEAAQYDAAAIIILVAAIAGKLLLGRFVSSQGQKVSSDSLVASGKDALNDAVLSASVLVSAVIYLVTGISLEAFVGIIIAVMIIRSGIEMITETLDKILGERADREQIEAIKATLCEMSDIHGAYDLILHSYGPDRVVGSVHVEVDDVLTADRIDALEREAAALVLDRHGVLLTGIGIYSRNTRDDEAAALQSEITRLVMSHEGVLQMHGFYLSREKKLITMDVILDFDVPDRHALYQQISEEVQRAAKGYQVHVTMDLDI